MIRPFRGTSSRSMVTGYLLAVADALSVAIGFTAVWVTLGPESLYLMCSISFIGLLTVPLLRASGLPTASYAWGLLSGVLVTCWMGLVIAFGVAGVLWAGALLVTAIPVRSLWARARPGATVRHTARAGGGGGSRRGGGGGSGIQGSGATAARTPAADTGLMAANIRAAVLAVPQLDLDALCLVWRRSYHQLLDAGLTPTGAAVVKYRQRILDEIDHRDPEGFSRWLASGPRAAGNPLPYLHRPAVLDVPPETGD
ncbi:MAG: hypothetical protein QOK15_2603 [Nocardioidaceae bacterium]|nr:hypothetical protein [Nocardioidaceae bacterium]